MEMRNVKFGTKLYQNILYCYDVNLYNFSPNVFISIFHYVIASTDGIPEASMEVDVAKGRRDWAFSERDKVK